MLKTIRFFDTVTISKQSIMLHDIQQACESQLSFFGQKNLKFNNIQLNKKPMSIKRKAHL